MTSTGQTVPIPSTTNTGEKTIHDIPVSKIERWRNRPGRVSRSKKKDEQSNDTKEEDMKAVMPDSGIFPDDIQHSQSGAYFDGDTPPRKNKRKVNILKTPEENEKGADKILESAVTATGQDDLFPDILAPPSLKTENENESSETKKTLKCHGRLSKDVSDAFKDMSI